MRKTLLAATMISAVWIVPACALEVSKSIEIPALPKSVWESVGGFCTIDDWDPGVTSCLLTKAPKPTRTLKLSDGRTIVEERQARDDEKMSYTYTIVGGPLPVSDYTSTLTVAPSGSGSKVTWSASFKAKGVPDAEAEKAVSDIYDEGLKGLADSAS